MSLVKRFVAASLATLALSALHAEPRCPGNVASLALRRIQDDLIVVRVRINRTGPYDFLVDTGSQITTIDPAPCLRPSFENRWHNRSERRSNPISERV